MIADFSKKSLEELRILDLGVLEGAFSIELARRGATVVGIEGREANIVVNAPDVFYFLERIAGMCDQFVIIDTQLQAVPETSQIYQGRVYWGLIGKTISLLLHRKRSWKISVCL